MASHEDRSKSSNKVVKDFSEANVEKNRKKKIKEDIEKIEKTNRVYLKARHEAIENEEKSWFNKEISLNNILIQNLKMSLNH